MMRRVAGALFLLSCGGGGSQELSVDVRTDYAPGVEFSAVRVELSDGAVQDAVALNTSDVVAAFLRGRRVAEFTEVARGRVRVEVTLLRGGDGSVLATRQAVARVAGPTAVTVVFTRSCEGVRCPGAGDAADATECVDGQCVPPECTPETPDACPPGFAPCREVADCTGPPLDACASRVCVAGSCLVERDDSVCEAGAFCDPEEGCVSLRDTDAGVVDAGVDGAGSCDCRPARCEAEGEGFVSVDAERCESRRCVPGGRFSCEEFVCEEGRCALGCDLTGDDDDAFCLARSHCDGGRCVRDEPNGGSCDEDSDCLSGYCESGICCDDGECCRTVADCPGGGATAAICEEPSRCQGSRGDAECASNRCVVEAGVDDDSACDAGVLVDCGLFDPLACSGAVDQTPPMCPSNCSGDAECVDRAHCEGGDCVLDGDAGDACTATRQCAAGLVCADGVCCDGACTGDCEACNVAGAEGTCSPRPSGTVCRAAAGPCDREEVCSGGSRTCPIDIFLAATTVCRPEAGECDVEERCTGTGPSCPGDVLRNNTVCRASAGDCDREERCNGTSVDCPVNGFLGSSTVCRTSAGECDVEERCSGTSAACPSNGFAPSSMVCRAASGDCDIVERCTGSSAGCPGDAFLSGGTLCRSATGSCDIAEVCTGGSASCPGDAMEPDGTMCDDTMMGMCGTCQPMIGGSCFGMQMCPVTTFACMAGTCESSTTSSSRSCQLPVGAFCNVGGMPGTCDNFGNCRPF
ncbi:MAG: hypothetical protein AAGE52_05975 [Myxococcota bacterium]